MQKPALLLEIDGNWPIRAEKRQHLKLQTSKSKKVKSFENFGKNSSIRELFGKFDAFQGLKLHAYFFWPKSFSKSLRKFNRL